VLSARSRIWGKAIQTDAKISPSNYGGPLVDIRGRVLGVLVPLSPQRQDEIAGAEWYDSGIGFAIPLADILPQLEKMKQGEDLHPGILGITLKGNNIYADPPEIAAVQPKSPAYQGGLKAGDRIVEVDGLEVENQAQLKHALGPRYAGETVKLIARRGEERLEAAVQLTDKLEPYEHPFLGVLPDRSPAPPAGITVRYVYPGSPAAEAGIEVEDRLVRLDEKPIADLNAALEILANHEPREKIQVAVERDGETRQLEIELAGLPTAIPEKLPAARKPVEAAAPERPPVGEVAIKIPEEKNDCFAYVPTSYHPRVAYGVLLWLHEPGGVDRQKVIDTWKPHCEANDLILLAPQSADPSRWVPTEIDFIRKTLDDVLANYNVDRTRTVAYGYQAGGSMAYLTTFAHRTLLRAVAAGDAALPARVQVPPNDPIERLAVFMTVAKESRLADRVAADGKRLQEMRYPVIVRQHDGQARPLSDEERAELVRWIDTLDRL
jgi:serine protease Do